MLNFNAYLSQFDSRKHHVHTSQLFKRYALPKIKKEAANKCIEFLSGQEPEFKAAHKDALQDGTLKICFDAQTEACPELNNILLQPSIDQKPKSGQKKNG